MLANFVDIHSVSHFTNVLLFNQLIDGIGSSKNCRFTHMCRIAGRTYTGDKIPLCSSVPELTSLLRGEEVELMPACKSSLLRSNVSVSVSPRARKQLQHALTRLLHVATFGVFWDSKTNEWSWCWHQSVEWCGVLNSPVFLGPRLAVLLTYIDAIYIDVHMCASAFEVKMHMCTCETCRFWSTRYRVYICMYIVCISTLIYIHMFM